MAQGAPDGPRKVLGWPTIWIAAAIILSVTIGSGVLLFWIYPPPGSKEALDIIRTAGTLGVGTGGAAALLLHARRQRSTEESNEITREANKDTRYDAEERRITELQAQANEHLGSESAPVRLGALTLLGRLANKYPNHRQEIVDILCGYLRMPFDHPDWISPRHAEDEDSLNRRRKESQQELQVRLTVQRMLAEHLVEVGDQGDGDPAERFWKEIRIDLRGAVLVDFSLPACRVNAGLFDHARFVGSARFSYSRFLGIASFRQAVFDGAAVFREVDFRDSRGFRGISRFQGARFSGHATFVDSKFDEGDFSGARFEGLTQFNRATFGGVAKFKRARFLGRIEFEGVDFAKTALWDDARRLWKGDFFHGNYPDKLPNGWIMKEPEAGEVGRITGESGVWGYIVRANGAQSVVTDLSGGSPRVFEADSHAGE